MSENRTKIDGSDSPVWVRPRPPNVATASLLISSADLVTNALSSAMCPARNSFCSLWLILDIWKEMLSNHAWPASTLDSMVPKRCLMTGCEIKVLPKTRRWQAHLMHSSTAARVLETEGVSSEKQKYRIRSVFFDFPDTKDAMRTYLTRRTSPNARG